MRIRRFDPSLLLLLPENNGLMKHAVGVAASDPQKTDGTDRINTSQRCKRALVGRTVHCEIVNVFLHLFLLVVSAVGGNAS